MIHLLKDGVLPKLAQVSVLAGCEECGGTGAVLGNCAANCELCRGTGEILKSRRVNGYGACTLRWLGMEFGGLAQRGVGPGQ